MGEWVYYLSLTACVLQIAGHLFTYLRTGRWASLCLGVPAFTFMTVGMLLIAVGATSQGDGLIPPDTLRLLLRLSFLVGSLLWIAEEAFTIAKFLAIRTEATNSPTG